MEKGNFKHIVDVEIIQEPDAELIRFRSTRATLSAGQKLLGSPVRTQFVKSVKIDQDIQLLTLLILLMSIPFRPFTP